MKKLLLSIAIIFLLSAVSARAGFLSWAENLFNSKPQAFGDTLGTLPQWTASSTITKLIPRNTSYGVQVPALGSANLCLKTDASGNFATTSCGSAGATTTINGLLGPNFTLAVGSGLSVATSAPNTITFTNTASGGGATTTINSVNGPAFTFATGTTGTNFNIATSTGTVTYNIPYSDATHTGLLQGSDWTTFNNKQSALSFPLAVNLGGTGSTSLNTTLVSEGTNLYYTDARARGSLSASNPITYNSGTGAIGWTNSNNYITLGSLSGTAPVTYNNGTGAIGLTTPLATTYGGTGSTSLNTTLVSEGTNLYYTDARARAAVSLTTTGSSGAATYSSATGVLNIPQYQAAGSYLTSVTADSPLSGAGTAGSHLIFTNPGYITGNQNITLSGDVSGSGTTAITTSYNNVVPINKGGTATTSAPTQTGQLMSSVGTGWGVSNLVNTTYATWTTSTPGSLSVSISGLQPAGSYLTAETDPVVKALNGIIVSNGSTISAITNNSTTWDKALQWDGGSTSLVAATGRTSLGLTDTATLASSTWLKVANNLSDLNNATTARTNLGLGGLAVLGVPAAGIVTSNGSALSNITDSSANWNTAYTDRLKWDGGSTGLVAATGRTSLGLGTMALEANTGSTTITTLGTIGTGTWNATTIGTSKGGTGITSGPTITGQLLMGNSSAWTVGNLVAGTNITITTSTPGSITIAASGGSGTVTSVDMSVPTGLTVSGNPITTAGTLAVSLQAGYNIPLTASTTNWNGFFDTPSSRITAGTGLSWSTNTLNASNAFTGSGTNGFVARWTSATALSAGKLIDNGTVLGMNATSSTIGFNIQGTAGTNDIFNIASSSTTSILKVTSASQVLIAPTARLTIPQGTAPTLSAAGDIAVDTTAGQLLYQNGGLNVLQATSSKTMTLVNPTASEDDDFGYFDAPITITKVTCSARNQNTSSMTFSLWHGTNRSGSGLAYLLSGQTCNGTTTPVSFTSFTDNTLAAGEMLVATTSSVTLASTTSITIFYKYDRQ